MMVIGSYLENLSVEELMLLIQGGVISAEADIVKPYEVILRKIASGSDSIPDMDYFLKLQTVAMTLKDQRKHVSSYQFILLHRF